MIRLNLYLYTRDIAKVGQEHNKTSTHNSALLVLHWGVDYIGLSETVTFAI